MRCCSILRLPAVQRLSSSYCLRGHPAIQSAGRGQLRAMTDPTDIKVGDEVEWKWGGSKHISGEVVGKQEEGKAHIESKGKTITRNATPDNPAYKIEGASNPVLKKGSELTKVSEGGEEEGAAEEEAEEEEEEEEEEEASDEPAGAPEAPSSSHVRTRAQAKKAAS